MQKILSWWKNPSSDSDTVDETRKKRLQDARYTRVEKISTEEFASTLDDSVVDKIEDTKDGLGDIAVTLYFLSVFLCGFCRCIL